MKRTFLSGRNDRKLYTFEIAVRLGDNEWVDYDVVAPNMLVALNIAMHRRLWTAGRVMLANKPTRDFAIVKTLPHGRMKKYYLHFVADGYGLVR